MLTLRRVYVNSLSYPVVETPTLLKADLQGQFGWNSVWVSNTGDQPYTNFNDIQKNTDTSTFDEVQGGLDESNALFEARRCMSCGNCFECDNCYGVCPDNAVIKLGPGRGFEFNLDYCKGCGICAAECPCGAIEMTPESV